MDIGEHMVAAMLKKAEQVVADVQRDFQISHVVAAYSGGDDSIVSTHWTMERFPGAVVMTADTQIGLEVAKQHSEKVCRDLGFAREIVSPSPGGPPAKWQGEWLDAPTTYEEFVLNFGFPGPGMHPRMYQRLKQRAFRKLKPRLGKRPRGSRILVVSGIRHDESAIRAGYKRAYREEPKECFVWMNPFYWCTAQDFEAYRQEYGLPRNPVKQKCGISGECCCGTFAAPGEMDAYRSVEPSFADRLQALRNRVKDRFPWGWGEKPVQAVLDQHKENRALLLRDETPQFMPACVGCDRRVRGK
jgi:3'-phosphoadenosine 5'-phosphosulfate sulfotransferase (PAPS reductase)/FAD synthetase